IQPVLLGSAERALSLSQDLLERGFLAGAIRPPTVPPGTARLRLTVTATHTAQAVDDLLNAMAELAPRYLES
ncbi:aminotransferase class I/II-fold pyridoxal phosphate-dependent enzyme, partial [Acinetobacter baumannii]